MKPWWGQVSRAEDGREHRHINTTQHEHGDQVDLEHLDLHLHLRLHLLCSEACICGIQALMDWDVVSGTLDRDTGLAGCTFPWFQALVTAE